MTDKYMICWAGLVAVVALVITVAVAIAEARKKEPQAELPRRAAHVYMLQDAERPDHYLIVYEWEDDATRCWGTDRAITCLSDSR